MNEESPSDPALPGNARSQDSVPAGAQTKVAFPWRGILYLLAAVGIFLLGFMPMWLKARENAAQRDIARVETAAIERELTLARLETSIASAAIEARRGEYEAARQSSSQFFRSLQEQMDRGVDADLSSDQRNALAPLLALRDDLITLLARNDPACAERLAEIYLTARDALRSP
jgi:hypothetical protein